MTQPVVFLDGKKLPLGKRLGKGGEGEVYALDDDSGRALKYYTAPDGLTRERKIMAMLRVRLAERSSLVAFPMEVVRHRDGKFAGFVMRLVSGHKPLHELYAPKARKQNFPRADYRFLVRAAANIARAVASVHKAGCVIGDINHSGILISEQAIAALIDADSFQIVDGNERHLCLVGVPEYTPPELQGQSLKGIVRTADHDAFGLAIVVFQLLFMGRHPFMGSYSRGEMPIQQAISEHRFAYGHERRVGMTPPPGICTLNDIPQEIGGAFEAAFAADRSTPRPTAEQWVHLLEGLEHSLRRCGASELHYYSAAAPKCPWCRMEQMLGLALFLPYSPEAKRSPAFDPGADAFNFTAVWAAIETVRIPAKVDPPPPRGRPPPSKAASDAVSARTIRQITGAALIVGAIVVFAIAIALWPVWLGLGGFGLNRLFASSEKLDDFKGRYVRAHQQWEAAIADWHKRCGWDELQSLKAELTEAKKAYEGLVDEQKRRIATYQQNRRKIQLETYLDRFLIRRARIRGIGPAKQAALASYGIETAEDVTAHAVLRVPGFGEATARALLEWRYRLEARFQYDDRPNDADKHEYGKIITDIAQRASVLRAKLLAGATDLKNAARTLEGRSEMQDPVLARLHREKLQATVDLEFLGIPTPTVPASPSQGRAATTSIARPGTVTQPPPAKARPTSTPPSCPSCGQRMVKRMARRGLNRGNFFWGCSSYPACHGTRSIP